MYREEAFENLKEAWEEFCRVALCDKGKQGTYRGQAVSVLAIGEFLLEHIEDTVDLDEPDEDETDQAVAKGEAG